MSDSDAEARLDLLVLTDLHYIGRAQHKSPLPERKTALGIQLLQAARRAHDRIGLGLDGVIVLGDMVDDGHAPNAQEDLAEVAKVVSGFGVPVLAVPGNHDGSQKAFRELFGCQPGLHRLGGYGFLTFVDEVGEGDHTTRTGEGLALPRCVRAEHPELELIALQHNPLWPEIAHEYPFMLTNGAEVLAGYERAGVVLSLSGHYHPGEETLVKDGTTYATLPTMCEAPFRAASVHLRGAHAEVRLHRLEVEMKGAKAGSGGKLEGETTDVD